MMEVDEMEDGFDEQSLSLASGKYGKMGPMGLPDFFYDNQIKDVLDNSVFDQWSERVELC